MDLESQAATFVSRGHVVKKWPQLFSSFRIPKDTGPFVDTLRQVDAVNDGVELFMQEYDDDTANICFETVARISDKVTIGDFNHQHLSKRGTAWLDDHSTNPTSLERRAHGLSDNVSDFETSTPTLNAEQRDPRTSIEEAECDIADAHNAVNPIARVDLKPREHPDHLTARDLYSRLREKRFDHDFYEDAVRRLIYIVDPDRCDILALTETVREDQKRALYDVLWQFYAHQTSLKVKISPLIGGYCVFQLELHIPSFPVRRTPLEELQNDTWKKAHQDWVDLSFLDDYGQDEVLGMHKTQFSLTICGSNNSCWVAFCLEETKFDEDREAGDNERGPGWRADQISMGKIEAELPLRDPREYFLAIWRIRLGYTVEEMEGLVVRAETSLSRKTSASASAPMTSEWIEEMLKLADCAMHNISKLTDQWNRFHSNSGDIGYFNDAISMDPPALGARMQDALATLNDMFVEMAYFEKRLRYVQNQCLSSRSNLEHRLVLRNGQYGRFTLLVMSPFLIVASIFAIPTKIVPFDISMLSFLLSVGICMLLLYVLHGLVGGWLGRQVWLHRLKELKPGDPTITKKKESGETVLRRRTFTRKGIGA